MAVKRRSLETVPADEDELFASLETVWKGRLEWTSREERVRESGIIGAGVVPQRVVPL